MPRRCGIASHKGCLLKLLQCVSEIAACALAPASTSAATLLFHKLHLTCCQMLGALAGPCLHGAVMLQASA